jgi:hypothetical protein
VAGRGAQHHGLVRCGWRATTVDGPAAAKRRGGARPRYHASHGTNAHHRLEHDKITRGTWQHACKCVRRAPLLYLFVRSAQDQTHRPPHVF